MRWRVASSRLMCYLMLPQKMTCADVDASVDDVDWLTAADVDDVADQSASGCPTSCRPVDTVRSVS